MRLAVLYTLVGLALQLAMLDGFAWLWETAYGEPRAIDESYEQPLTTLGLVCGGPMALALGLAALYRALRSESAAWRRVGLCGSLLPVLLVGTAGTHVLLCVHGVW